MSALTLTPNTVHCVKTGLMVAKLPEQLDGLNKALASGMLEAGMHTGHIRLSQSLRDNQNAKLIASGGSKLKAYFWGKAGSNTTARRIAAHNEAMLQQHGWTADPSTKTKGQLSKRQYGVYAAPQPKVVENVDVMDFLAGMTVVPDVDLSTLEREPVEPTVPAIVMPKPPADVVPETTELSVRGGFGKFRSRASKAGMDMPAIQSAWATARDAHKQSTQPKVVESKPEVKAQPKVGQPSTIRVDANALAATLSALTAAKIVSNEGAVFTVEYSA